MTPCYASPCCEIQDGPGCADLTNEAYAQCVGDIDAHCVTTQWDQQCINEAMKDCGLRCPKPPVVVVTESPTMRPTRAPTMAPTTAAPTKAPTTKPPTDSTCTDDTFWTSSFLFEGCAAYSIDDASCDSLKDGSSDGGSCNYCYCNGGFPTASSPADSGPDSSGDTVSAGVACPTACQTCESVDDRYECPAPRSRRSGRGDPRAPGVASTGRGGRSSSTRGGGGR